MYHLVRDVDNERGYACVGVRSVQKISVPSPSILLINLKLLEKNKILKKFNKRVLPIPKLWKTEKKASLILTTRKSQKDYKIIHFLKPIKELMSQSNTK